MPRPVPICLGHPYNPPIMTPSPVDQLDVQQLLEISEPQPSVPWAWYAIGVGVLLAGIDHLLSGQSPEMDAALNAMCAITMTGVLAALMGISWFNVRAVRAQSLLLDQIAEMIQLRKWPEAAVALRRMLSAPVKTHHFRAQALVYFSVILARYERFDAAIEIQEYLLDHEMVDPGSAFGLRVGRAMAMLRLDRLFDADRAIAELRRMPGSGESGGFALLEIYRDVKTGHPTEALQMFQQKLSFLRDQLGHRVADAWALVARAHDLLGNDVEAKEAVNNATLLVPPAELLRRYPELRKLTDKYVPAPMPAM
jgi:hypothetical protein